MPSKRLAGTLFILFSATCFGASPIFARIAFANHVDLATLLFLRFSLATAVLCIVLAARRLRLPSGRLLLALVALGAFGYAGQALAYFTAISLAPVALVVLLLYVYPALVALLAVAFLGERFTPVKGVALALALGGAALTVGPVAGGSRAGIAAALVAAVIYGGYILVSSRLTPRAGAFPSAAVIIASAAVVYGVAFVVRGAPLPTTAAGWGAIAALGIVSTVLSIVSFFAGLERIGPTNASMLSTFEPAVSVALGAAVLGEPVTPLQFAGGALILAAVGLLVKGGGRAVARETAAPAEQPVVVPDP